MTKKDYIAIANHINAVYLQDGMDLPTISHIVGRLVGVFADDNPRFDTTRFLDACFAKPVKESHE